MRIIFSRKGFDSAYGGAPSPIEGGRPISLFIPDSENSRTTYAELGLGDYVERLSKKTNKCAKCRRDSYCHEDPVFNGRRWALGQCGWSQSHLARQGVGRDDVFLFFGLFQEFGGSPHHRIFGYMRVDEVLYPGADPQCLVLPGFERPHPHTIGKWHKNNAIYVGDGARSRSAPDRLRMSIEDDGRVSRWRIPPWLSETRLSCHTDWRWATKGELRIKSPGQEFVANIGDRADAKDWLAELMEYIDQA